MLSSSDTSPALSVSDAKNTKINKFSIIQIAFILTRWICFLLYPYLLTVLVNCIAAYDSNAVSFLLENRPGAFYFGLFIRKFCYL